MNDTQKLQFEALDKFYRRVWFHSRQESRYIHFAKAVERELKQTTAVLENIAAQSHLCTCGMGDGSETELHTKNCAVRSAV